ncbi:MAG: flagellar M-ring protein FliF [Deltaproteobacteria bacterium]|nr:flagellar M-ring protein FliF [Deltaproteobacteria bacterium]
MNTLGRFLQQIRSVFLALPTHHKILYIGALLLAVGSLSAVVISSNRPDYTPLYSGMSESDMGDVIASLKAKKIPYRISSSGNAVEVGKDQLYETRLALAREGIPKGASIGFEIFDQQKLGSTEFVQRINYQRALQGELARTINEMDEVLESRVHLVMPEESLFVSEQKPPSAAVVIKLRPGARLEQKHIQGIVHLVAGTVRGLKEEEVTVLSTDGQVLFKKNGSDQPMQITGMQMEIKGRIEEDLRKKVQSMLEHVIGINRVLTRTSVDLDFNQVQIAEENYDPDSAVIRSQQRSIENSDGKELAAKGNPDVPINVESKLMQSTPQGDAPPARGKQFSRQRETINFEINRVSRQIVQSPGTVKKVSVAVIVDGPYEMKQEADGTSRSVFVGRSPEELKSIEELVKKAVGFNETRGDQINVSNIPFAVDTPGGEPMAAQNRWIKLFKSNQKILLNLLLGLLVFVFIIRPFMKKFQELGTEFKNLPKPAPALPEGESSEAALLMEQSSKSNKLTIRKKAVILAQKDTERATDIIRGLLREEE